MNVHRYKRVSISLDRNSHEHCKVLANERTTSVSGLLRILIMDAYEKHERLMETTDRSRPRL
jgi:hypothetical protein